MPLPSLDTERLELKAGAPYAKVKAEAQEHRLAAATVIGHVSK